MGQTCVTGIPIGSKVYDYSLTSNGASTSSSVRLPSQAKSSPVRIKSSAGRSTKLTRGKSNFAFMRPVSKSLAINITNSGVSYMCAVCANATVPWLGKGDIMLNVSEKKNKYNYIRKIKKIVHTFRWFFGIPPIITNTISCSFCYMVIIYILFKG